MAKKRSAEDAPQQHAPAVDEEVAFPRGGGSSVSALDAKKLRAEGAAQARADVAAEGGRKKQRTEGRSGKGVGGGIISFLGQEATREKLPKFVELLKFKTLSVGVKLWGAVLEVKPQELIVSLPHGLRGFVAPTEASDVLSGLLKKAGCDGARGAKWPVGVPLLTSLFHVGQLVRCTVIDLQQGDKKRVGLSLNVGRLNSGNSEALSQGSVLPACVKAVEDHGYSLTFGIKGASGFLLKSDYAAAHGAEARLVQGALVDVAVQSAADRRMVRVTAAVDQVRGGVLKDNEVTDLGSLLPGALVNARVKAVLSDGLLVNFLTYFTGTVDQFHLGQDLSKFEVNQRLRARIIAVDAAAKTVALSLQRHLLQFSLVPDLPAIGTVYEEAVIARVDPGLGAVLRLPASGSNPAAAGFAHVSAMSDERIEKLQKVFKPGQTVRARVIGARPLDGLAVLSLKASVIEQSLMSASDVAPGQLVIGKIASIDDKGAWLALSPGVKAFVPLIHLSDTGGKKGKAKWAVGQQVTARVLEADAGSKRLTATLKKTLVASKLPPIVHLEDAVPGARATGTVTGVTETGVFVAFFNGITGLVHASQLGLTPEQTPEDAFKVGQVLKVRVLKVDAARRRLGLGLASAPAPDPAALNPADGADALGGLQPGNVVEDGVVSAVHAADGQGQYYEVQFPEGAKGRLDVPHLADHPAAVEALKAAVAAGSELGPLVVLERLERVGLLRLSRKASLIAAAQAAMLPTTIDDVREAALLPGYIASLTPDAAYVRFGANLTGRAGLPQLADSFVSDPARHYVLGQSVRAQVVQVDREKQRFSLALKPALTASPDAALLASLFADLELAATLRNAANAEDAAIPWDRFPVGGIAAGSAHAREEYGLVCDLEADDNVVGLVAPHQEGGELRDVGAALSGRVLDVSKADGVVDLSLLPLLLPPPPKEGKKAKQPNDDKWKAGSDKVDVTVQLVKPDYLVVSLPQRKPANPPSLGFISTRDYNLLAAPDASLRRFTPGQALQATVAAVPSDATGGRLLMHMALQSEAAAAAADAAAKKRIKSKAAPGRIVEGAVMHCTPLLAEVKLESGEKGRLHVTEWRDVDASKDPADAGDAFANAFPEGGSVRAVVLGTVATPAGKRHGLLELSARPSAVAAANDAGNKIPEAAELASLKAGAPVVGFVQEVADAHVWVALSPTLRGRLHSADGAGEPSELADLGKRFAIGQSLRCRILQVDRASHSVDLSQQDVDSGKPASGADPAPGSLVMGRVVTCGGGGLRLHLAEGRQGRVALTDLHDTYVDNALTGLTPGTMVRGRVLPPPDESLPASKDTAVPLSLKASAGGAIAGRSGDPTWEAANAIPAARTREAAKEPAVGDQVHGYVSSVGKAGAFVALRGGLTARIKLAHLSDGYIENPAEEFAAGKHVRGRIMAVEGSRIEMSLRSAKSGANAGAASVAEIPVGAVLEGRVKTVQPFGVFVEVGEHGGPTGLAHISEVSDEFVGDIHAAFKSGQSVRVKVLKVDPVANKLSLTLRPSAVGGGSGDEEAEDAMEVDAGSGSESDLDEEMAARLEQQTDEVEPLEGDVEDDLDAELAEDNGASDADTDGQADLDSELEADDAAAALTEPQVETPKTLDLGEADAWGEAMDAEEAAAETAAVPVEGESGKKLSKQQKKRLKIEKEAALRQAELDRIDPDKEPQSADAFEQLVAGQPNSSHAWIRYMAFLLTVGDADAARAVAERALQTINYREEDEKFNVWAALLNLENTYGSPPEEAAMATFRRAATHTDPKKLHLHAASMFERTGRMDAARTLLKAACRKYSTSAKVWLRAYGLEIADAGSSSTAAQKVLDRALAALPSRKHIKVVTHAGLLEFKSGSAERGRSLFEGVLRNYPKRLDLWSVYLDQEIKAGDPDRTRALFERAITLQLPPKKMKFFFKRYLEFEQQQGDAARVEHVKNAAREYVESAAMQS